MGLSDEARRVLIVEDEPLIAMNLEDMLTELGHRVTGIATRIDQAQKLVRNGDFDISFLDINISGSTTFQIAAILRKQRIPFIFTTGYGADGLIDDYRSAPLLTKPFTIRDLDSMLARVLAGD